MTLGDVTEKGSMVSKMPCPPCRPFHPIGEAGLWMSAIWIQGGGAPLSWGGAHQTLFLFPERGLRESGTAAWAHYPRADSGLLGRCDTDVTVTARGTEFAAKPQRTRREVRRLAGQNGPGGAPAAV